MKVEVKNGKEIIIGEMFGNDVPFFVKDIKQRKNNSAKANRRLR